MKKITLLALLFTFPFISCFQEKKEYTSPAGYDFTKPEKTNMPESLHEISGIVFHDENSDTIYAIQDEEGKVFRMARNSQKQYHSKFGKQGDYEDLTILHDNIFILKSNGSLFSFPFEDAIYNEVDSVKEWKKLLAEGEYESMYGNEATGALYVLCKNCPNDKQKQSITGYKILVDDSIPKIEPFQFDVSGIRSFNSKVKDSFRPSAITKNPITGDWFVISAVNQVLAVADSNWVVKDVCQLNGNIFNQPEGITFDKEGNLYISNEGDDVIAGNILKFALQKK